MDWGIRATVWNDEYLKGNIKAGGKCVQGCAVYELEKGEVERTRIGEYTYITVQSWENLSRGIWEDAVWIYMC
jgi:hypothetical protein